MDYIIEEVIKYDFVQMLREKKVNMLLHTTLAGVIMDGQRIKGIIIENKSGRQAVLANMVIDATEDAGIAAYAGAPFQLAKKPLIKMFNIVGVHVPKALG